MCELSAGLKLYGVIYLVTNTVNGKCYIGQTTSPKPIKRWYGHVRTSRRKVASALFSRAIRKYGEQAFHFGVIWFAKNQAELDRAEDYFIQLLATRVPEGYNLKAGGSGGKHSEVTKQKMKATLAIPAIKERNRIAVREALARPEVRLKRSISQAAVWSTPHMKAKRGRITKEVHARPGMKEKHQAAVTAVVSTPEVKARHLAAILEAFARPETKALRSALRKELRWINDGSKNRRLKKDADLPAGWVYGLFLVNGHWKERSPEKFAAHHARLTRIGNQAMCAKYEKLRLSAV